MVRPGTKIETRGKVWPARAMYYNMLVMAETAVGPCARMTYVKVAAACASPSILIAPARTRRRVGRTSSLRLGLTGGGRA